MKPSVITPPEKCVLGDHEKLGSVYTLADAFLCFELSLYLVQQTGIFIYYAI